MKTNFLLQTLCISLLLCFTIQAKETEPQNILNAPLISAGKGKTFSLPFAPQDNDLISHQLGLSIQFSETNRTIPVSVNTRSSGLWVNNRTKWPSKGFNFDCEASQTCKPQGLAQYTWIEQVGQSDWNDGPRVAIFGNLVKEKVNLGSVTLPDADVLIVNDFSEEYMPRGESGASGVKGALGLNFRRNDRDIPTFFEYLKTEGFVDKSIFSIFLDKSNHGEFMFGGFDLKKVESEFQYAKWEEDRDRELPGFSLQIKRIGYGDTFDYQDLRLPIETLVIDFEHPDIVVPEWIINMIDHEESSRGLNETTKTCKAIPFMQDIVIEFNGMTLRIPPAAYTTYGEVTYYEGEMREEKKVMSCQRSLTKAVGQDRKIILGRPFLKLFYTVFNLEEKTVGFSKRVSLEKEYPFSEAAGDYPVLRSYMPWEVRLVFAVLLIASFCVLLYCIIKAWKGIETASPKNLVSPKIDIEIPVGIPVYSRIHNGNQEVYQEESKNLDVGKTTIEEEKLYA